jgi:hypothetical protein
VIWATPAGRSLVARQPGPFAGKLTCPATDQKLVPNDLVTKAQELIGKPRVPMQGSASAKLAATLAAQNPKAASADVANALIAAYCLTVTAAASATPAQQASWVEGFGQQVIQTLQLRAAASKG